MSEEHPVARDTLCHPLDCNALLVQSHEQAHSKIGFKSQRKSEFATFITLLYGHDDYVYYVQHDKYFHEKK